MQKLEYGKHVSTSSSVVEQGEAEDAESLAVRLVSDVWNQSGSSPLYTFDQLLVSSVEWTPGSVRVVEVRAYEGLEE